MSASVKAKADRAEARARGEKPEYEFKSPTDDTAKPGGSLFGLWSEIAFPELTSNGAPRKNSMMNVRRVIEFLNIDVRYDEFLNVYTISGPGMEEFSGELTDMMARKFREVCYQHTAYEPGKDGAFEGLLRHGEENKFHSLRAQLDILKWDGTSQLDTWLMTYCGVEDTPLHREWGRLWLTAAVRRVYDPGCKFDHVPVLEGPEGEGKSSVGKIIACGQATQRPQYFSDTPILDKPDREQQELTRGVWIYELAELAGMRKGDLHRIKAFITREEERAREAYARLHSRQARISIFYGTFNTDAVTGRLVEYLNQGDWRRWWGIPVGKILLDLLARDRWQLLAEAKEKAQPKPELGITEWASLQLAEKFWKEAGIIAAQREVADPLVDQLSSLYDELIQATAKVPFVNGHHLTRGVDFDVTDSEVWIAVRAVIKMLPSNLTSDGRRLAAAMARLDWQRGKLNRNTRIYKQPLRSPEADLLNDDVAMFGALH